jgi:hypothetical protein
MLIKNIKVEFINKDTNEVIHQQTIRNNMWTQNVVKNIIFLG